MMCKSMKQIFVPRTHPSLNSGNKLFSMLVFTTVLFLPRVFSLAPRQQLRGVRYHGGGGHTQEVIVIFLE